jgi:hypothetical protein
LLFLDVYLDLRELSLRKPNFNEDAVAMRTGSVTIRESQEDVLSAQVLLHEHVEFGLRSIIWHLLRLDIDLLFSPYTGLLILLLLLLLFFLLLLQ